MLIAVQSVAQALKEQRSALDRLEAVPRPDFTMPDLSPFLAETFDNARELLGATRFMCEQALAAAERLADPGFLDRMALRTWDRGLRSQLDNGREMFRRAREGVHGLQAAGLVPPQRLEEFDALAQEYEDIAARFFDEWPVVVIGPGAFLRSMWAILWRALCHPLCTTVVDLSTGEAVSVPPGGTL